MKEGGGREMEGVKEGGKEGGREGGREVKEGPTQVQVLSCKWFIDKVGSCVVHGT